MTFRFFFLQKRVKLRTDLSELEKIGIKSFNLGILRTRVWTVKDHYPMKKILLFNFCGDEQ